MRKTKRSTASSDSIDRISQLPRDLLAHIVRLMPQKEAVQTSLLSKAWRNTWTTRPNIDFSWLSWPNPRSANEENLRLSALYGTLQRYKDQNLYIEEFELDVSIDSIRDRESDWDLFVSWIIFIILRGTVKKFNLYMSPQCRRYYDISAIIFDAESFEDISVHQCILENDIFKNRKRYIIEFNRLKKLSLSDTYIDDDTFQNIIWNCPLIEELEIENCLGLNTIKVINDNLPNLKFFYFTNIEIKKICGSTSIEIDAPSLEAIRIEYCTSWLNGYSFPKLKSLFLEVVGNLSLGDLTPLCKKFPCLQELRIYLGHDYDEIDISGDLIKDPDLDLSDFT